MSKQNFFVLILAAQLASKSPVYAQTVPAQNCRAPLSHLQKDTTLEQGCIYNVAFKITKPLTLDCRGAALDGEGRLMRAIDIDSLGAPLSGVTIKNCRIQNYAKTGIGVSWSKWDDEKVLLPRSEIYARTPSDILIENVVVDRSGAVGIYLDDYVSNVKLNKVTVSNTYGVGIYLEHSSRNNTISNSVIHNNGKQWSTVPWQPGISIDSSAGNIITLTRFSNNGKSGISLYRNCWESAKENLHSVPRWQGATGNIIEENHFLDERVGVWVGERMTRNVAPMRCGMPAYHTEGSKVFVLDDAKQNRVSNNTFKHMRDSAVIVEDDENEVVSNMIQESGGPAIKVGAPLRARVLGKPVVGTLVNANKVDGILVGATVTDQAITKGRVPAD